VTLVRPALTCSQDHRRWRSGDASLHPHTPLPKTVSTRPPRGGLPRDRLRRGGIPRRSVPRDGFPRPARPGGPPRLLDQLRLALRARHYSKRTEQAYCLWVRRYIHFHDLRHPAEMAEPEINASSHTWRSPTSQRLDPKPGAVGASVPVPPCPRSPVGDLSGVVRARVSHRVPVVLTRRSASRACAPRRRVPAGRGADVRLGTAPQRVSASTRERHRLRAARNHGAGGKGDKDRRTMLPRSLDGALTAQLERARWIHRRDLADGWAAWSCREPLSANTRGPPRSGTGSGCSRRPGDGATTRPGSRAGTTYTPA